MKYQVTIRQVHFHHIEIEAKSEEDAKTKALGKFWQKAAYDPWADEEVVCVTEMEEK